MLIKYNLGDHRPVLCAVRELTLLLRGYKKGLHESTRDYRKLAL